MILLLASSVHIGYALVYKITAAQLSNGMSASTTPSSKPSNGGFVHYSSRREGNIILRVGTLPESNYTTRSQEGLRRRGRQAPPATASRLR